MSADEKISTESATVAVEAPTDTVAETEKERSEKILNAKELYSQGSRNYLVRNYIEAADELSQVCAIYEEQYGELSDELGMPYLLYAKSLVALALEENKVIDVPEEEDGDDDDEDDEDENDGTEANGVEMASDEAAASSSTNDTTGQLDSVKQVEDINKSEKVDSTAGNDETVKDTNQVEKLEAAEKKTSEETQVSSTGDEAKPQIMPENGASAAAAVTPVVDDEKPSTSNGDAGKDEEAEEENEVASTLQLAWEILESAAIIFSRQGLSGLPNLAEVQTELANIEFENSILDGARDDYEKALKIYSELPEKYRRAMAEIHYKIGLTYLMQQLNKQGAESLKAACNLIDQEIEDIKAKAELTEKDKNNIEDMQETQQEIWAKIAEIEETEAQNIAEVRAALDSYIKPTVSGNADDAGPSSSASAADAGHASSSSISSSSKPTDISHLIKRKKPEDHNSEAEAASPAKRPAA